MEAVTARRAATIAAVTASLGMVASHGGWLVDDAGVALATARNLAAGHGLVAYPGGPVVEGVSDPAWVAALAAASAVGLPLAGTAKALGAAGAAAATLGAAAIARRLDGEEAGAGAALLVGLCGPLALWGASGLEGAWLAGWLTLAVAIAHPGGAALCLAIAATSRPEAPLLATAAWWARGAVHGSRGGIGLAAILGATAALLAARLATTGLWVPNTALAKLSGPWWPRGPRGLVYVAASALWLGLPAWGPGLRGGGRRLALVAPLAVAIAVAIGVGGDWMRYARLLLPAAPLAMAAAAGGLTGRRWRPLLGLALLWHAAVAVDAWRRPPLPLALVDELGALVVAVGPAACGEARPTYAGPDVGGVLWAHPAVVVYDLGGLVDPEVGAPWPARLPRLRPQVVLTHGPWARRTGLSPEVMARSGYVGRCARSGTVGPSEAASPTTFWLRADCTRPLPDAVEQALTAWCARPR